MNKQVKKKGGRGIEWCDYTWNPISGCFHGCSWLMPDGSIANCYAEDVADRVAQQAYPQGFEHHYYKPALLKEPARIKVPSRIFVGSMADVFGSWVPEDEIKAVLKVCADCPQHTFLFLTKNAPRLARFDFPENCHIGISAPPTEIMGKPLSRVKQERWFWTGLKALNRCNAKIKWVSFEPLSFDIADLFFGDGGEDMIAVLNWAVIGAASNGQIIYQPESEWVRNLIYLLDNENIPVFFKGNLRGNPALTEWREELPVTV